MNNETYLEPIVCFDGNQQQPDKIRLSHAEVVSFSARSPDKITINEDAFAVVPIDYNTTVLIVADGLGGTPGGETASKMVIEILLASLKRVSQQDIHIRGAILDGIEQANKEILQLKTGSATTLVIAEIHDQTLRTYHAGDSMIMLIGNKGKIKLQTVSHSPTGYALESGLIDEEQAMQHDERHLVSNYIGSIESRIEMGPIIKMAKRDTLILASDGLSDNLYDNEIVEFMRKGPLLKSSDNMKNYCITNMNKTNQGNHFHPDDLTFLAYRQSNN